ncbi:MAG: hypothetical protein ABR543_07645 [Gemmatimonadaceae bacterium]
MNEKGADPPARSYQVRVESPVEQRTAARQGGDEHLSAEGIDRSTLAILVCHGMGQQVRFETLDCVAKALLSRDPAHGQSDGDKKPSVKFAKFGEDWVPRTELHLGQGDRARTVHLYEAYWAPLTEGRVSGFDVVNFLFDAGWNGIKFSIRGSFDRWMFGERRPFPLSRYTFFHLGISSLAVIALAAGYLVFWGLAAAIALGAITQWQLSPASSALRVAVLWCALVLTGVLSAGLLSLLIKRLRGTPGRRRRVRKVGPVAFTGLLLMLGTIVWGAALLASSLSIRVPVWLQLYLLLASALGLVRVRWLLVQYVGDVAAYVSSHAVNKFFELRRQVQATGYVLAQNIYGARKVGSENFEYGEIIVAGHSLGSVVAYDTLNEMLRRDLAAKETGGGSTPLDVTRRTRLLLTFGSPLDKTAFIFRTQKQDAVFREALAAAMQPLIVDYSNRPEWVNIWSAFDWISGPLEYYDPPLSPDGSSPYDRHPARVTNIEENGSILPGKAHTGYWDRKAFGDTLYRAVVG